MRQLIFSILAAGAALSVIAPPARAATYHVAATGDDTAAGTQAAPFRTLQRGVDALKSGDTLLIGTGTYRERIEIRHGGTKERPVTITAAPGARVVVSGADRLEDGWTKAEGDIYVRDWPHVFPINRRPDGTLELTHPNDREHVLTGRAEQVIHKERLLRQALTRSQLAPGTFLADVDNKKLYVWLRDGGDPNREEMEASTRGEWLVAESDASFVHLRGIRFRYAANHAQRGAFRLGAAYGRGPTPPRSWIVEDCVFEWANGPGASLSGMGHLFRRCVFQDNGQLGFGAHFCHDTQMIACGIYRNNTKGYSTGWEAGGLKVVLSRGFTFDRCRAVDNRGAGIWYDIGNEKAEVKNYYIADNDEAGIFYEISYGLHAHDNLIVNNANHGETLGGAWGMGGITLSSSEDCVVENNTLVGNRDGIALREHGRTTPRIDQPEGAKEVRIFNRNHLVRNNLIAHSPHYNIALWYDVTFFGPHPSGGDKDRPISEDPKTLNLRFAGNLLHAPGRANYLYGPTWRPKSRTFDTPQTFAAATGLAVTGSRVADPRFTDVLAGDYRLLPGSPARRMGAGSTRAGERSREGL